MALLTEAEIAMYADRMKRALKTSTQNQIAVIIGVDQPYISRVLNGLFRRRVGRYAAILTYLDIQEKKELQPDTVSAAIKRYEQRGGDKHILERMIELLGDAQQSRRS